MAIAQSKLTAQGQISVPAAVRRLLGVGPGAVLELESENGQIVVRRADTVTSEHIHRAVFGDRPPAHHTLEEMEAGVRRRARDRNARR